MRDQEETGWVAKKQQEFMENHNVQSSCVRPRDEHRKVQRFLAAWHRFFWGETPGDGNSKR